MERGTGIEPATSSLGSWHSTAELPPLSFNTLKTKCLGSWRPRPCNICTTISAFLDNPALVIPLAPRIELPSTNSLDFFPPLCKWYDARSERPMICPNCGGTRSAVLDSRAVPNAIRRHRLCLTCEKRFTSYERTAYPAFAAPSKAPARPATAASKTSPRRPISFL